MKSLLSLTIVLVVIASCCENGKHTVSSQQEAEFILDTTELRLISGSSCDFKISFDSLHTLSEYDSIRRKFYSMQANIEKKACIEFTYLGNINARPGKVLIQSIPTSYGIVATTIPAHSILHITAFRADWVLDLAGNEFPNEQIPSDSLHHYIRRLFLNPPDSSRYGEKRVTFHLPDDSINLANKYLTELVIGYIAAQRQICRNKFHKDLKAASIEELEDLRSEMPLRFKIVPLKTNAVIGARSGAGP